MHLGLPVGRRRDERHSRVLVVGSRRAMRGGEGRGSVRRHGSPFAMIVSALVAVIVAGWLIVTSGVLPLVLDPDDGAAAPSSTAHEIARRLTPAAKAPL